MLLMIVEDDFKCFSIYFYSYVCKQFYVVVEYILIFHKMLANGFEVCPSHLINISLWVLNQIQN